MEAITLESSQLTNPVDDAAAHWSPIIFVTLLADDIFTVTMPNTLFGQRFIAGWIRRAAERGGVARIPVQHKVLVWSRLERGSRFFAGRCITRHLIFEQQHDVILGAALRRLPQLRVDRLAIWPRIIEAPIVETANSIGVERLRQRDAVLEQLVLCAGIEVGVELIAGFTLR